MFANNIRVYNKKSQDSECLKIMLKIFNNQYFMTLTTGNGFSNNQEGCWLLCHIVMYQLNAILRFRDQ